jgi:hypothetical protein
MFKILKELRSGKFSLNWEPEWAIGSCWEKTKQLVASEEK